MGTRLSRTTLFLLLVTGFLFAQAQVGINESGTAPAVSSILDVSSTSKGFLAPRMSEAQRLAITTPPAGLIVYQTNAASGYWYFDPNTGGWTKAFRGSQPWTVRGNTGTTPTSQFLGTTNNQPLIFGTNGSEIARFENNGRFRLGGGANPTQHVHVEGAVKLSGTSSSDAQGAIRWNATDAVHEGNVDGTATGWYPLENTLNEKFPATHYASAASGCSVPPGGYVQIGAGTGQTAGTIQTPFGTGWEDKKTQFLWKAADLAAAGICPNEDISALSFNTINVGTAVYPQDNAKLGMLQTNAPDLAAGFETGTVSLWSASTFSPVTGWNQFSFSSAFQWNGTSNVVVEYCFDNQDWAGNEHVATDATNYVALYGMYCDACGGNGYNTCANGGCGQSPQGGCSFTNNTSTVTCDGCGSWLGGRGPANKRPQIRFYCKTGTNPPPVPVTGGNLLWYNGGLIVGDAAWASGSTAGLPTIPANFKGPGTIHAENGVWGGGTLLNDHVFDIYFDGVARAEDSSKVSGYSMLSIEEMERFAERNRHLSTIPGRAEWDRNGRFGVDELNSHLWVTAEQQALYIKELNERIQLLQEHLVEQALKE